MNDYVAWKQSIPPAKSDDFGDFRQKTTDLVADIVFIVESNKCFEKVGFFFFVLIYWETNRNQIYNG